MAGVGGLATRPDPTMVKQAAEKRQIVEEARQPGATMSEVARRHGVRGEELYEWRRAVREGRSLEDDGSEHRFIPVVIQDEPPAPVEDPSVRRPTSIELVLRAGETLRFDARLDPALLNRVLRALRR